MKSSKGSVEKGAQGTTGPWTLRFVRPVAPLAIVAVAGWIVASSCEGREPAAPSRTPASMVKVGGDEQAAAAGTALANPTTIEVRDQAGLPMPGIPVRFDASAGGATSDTVLTTGSDGRASVEWLLGPDATVAHTLGVSTGPLSAMLTTRFSAIASPPAPGAVYLGRKSYIEYLAGDLPLIITAPHGGTDTPAEIPDRTGTNITTVRDGNTSELARSISAAFHARTGSRPHVIIVRLRRTKLDANREVVEAAQGNTFAERAWIEYHSFVEAAKRAVVARSGAGLYIDLHGHGHPIQRLELGYLLTRANLALPDSALDQATYENRSSLRTLSQASPSSFSELVRGPRSLGALFESQGFPAVPSPASRDAGADEYFDGGYNSARHGSRDGGPISGLQLEANFTGVRDTPANRERFANALVTVWQQFVGTHGAVTGAVSARGALAARPGARLPEGTEPHETSLLRIP